MAGALFVPQVQPGRVYRAWLRGAVLHNITEFWILSLVVRSLGLTIRAVRSWRRFGNVHCVITIQ
jgi:hypothetical protein